ncbi:MAG TPA: sulfatase [Abditibacteriaceae bacterium]|jgi:arylsulfatase A-like enzyme
MQSNVVIIAIDSLRADHLGCYGYGKNTSPNIDALARESVVFERAFAPGIPTMPSFTTLLTGLHPYRHGITAHAGEQRLSEDVLMLPQLAKRAGYVTIGIDNLAVQGSGRGSWFARGFDFYSGFLYKPFSEQSSQLADRAIGFIDEYSQKPFFMFVHLWDPHTPYSPREPYDALHYEKNAASPALQDVITLAPEYYNAFLGDMKLKQEGDYDYVVSQYDGEISYVDQQVGRIVSHLKAQGLWDNTIVVVLSDHGECFGEGDVYFDHHGLYDAVLRVAMLWHVPGAQAGRCSAIIANEDIMPTLIKHCGWPQPEYSLSSHSFDAALRNEPFAGRDFLVGVESTRQASLCWRTGKWKLILPITHDAAGNPLPDIYGNERDPEPLLFDLESDPGERHNVAVEYPQARDELLQQLQKWRSEEVARRGGHDPVLDGLSLAYDEFMERLTGRGLR